LGLQRENIATKSVPDPVACEIFRNVSVSLARIFPLGVNFSILQRTILGVSIKRVVVHITVFAEKVICLEVNL
jgi:hypothetical protein